MKRLMTTLLLLAAGMLAAQNSTQLPPPTRYTVSFESQHGESFSVFIDGNLQNRMPQSRVMVSDISDKNHEVVVVLKRPTEKAAVLSLRPGEPNVMVSVTYDQRLESLMLYTPSYNRSEYYDVEKPVRKEPKTVLRPVANIAPSADKSAPVSDERLASMVQQMRSQSFDNDRLALGKTLISSAFFTAEQIATLAETIDYSNSQVEFLKYAYAYCSDPVNYYVTVDVLTFSSDKKKVIDFIATQR